MNNNDYLIHYGILGMKWGIRRYQNPDGSLTEAGKKRYSYDDLKNTPLSSREKAELRRKMRRAYDAGMMQTVLIDTRLKKVDKYNKKLLRARNKNDSAKIKAISNKRRKVNQELKRYKNYRKVLIDGLDKQLITKGQIRAANALNNSLNLVRMNTLQTSQLAQMASINASMASIGVPGYV